jgi:hypothetical protein
MLRPASQLRGSSAESASATIYGACESLEVHATGVPTITNNPPVTPALAVIPKDDGLPFAMHRI